MEVLFCASENGIVLFLFYYVLFIKLKLQAIFWRAVNFNFSTKRNFQWYLSNSTSKWFPFVGKFFLQILTLLTPQFYSDFYSKVFIIEGLFLQNIQSKKHPFPVTLAQACLIELSVMMVMFSTCPLQQPDVAVEHLNYE